MASKLDQIAAKREELDKIKADRDAAAVKAEQDLRDQRHDDEVARLQAEIDYETTARELLAKTDNAEPVTAEDALKAEQESEEEILAQAKAAVDASQVDGNEELAPASAEVPPANADGPELPKTDDDDQEGR